MSTLQLPRLFAKKDDGVVVDLPNREPVFRGCEAIYHGRPAATLHSPLKWLESTQMGFTSAL